MINSLFAKFFPQYRWKFIATVDGPTFFMKDGKRQEGGNYTCYWNLYERGNGERRFELIGTNRGSQAANFAEAQVRAWKRGGPLPKANYLAHQPLPPKASKPNLITFPGGRDGAA